jgi:hypothetical protein
MFYLVASILISAASWWWCCTMGVQELDVGLIFSKSIFARPIDLGHHTL